MEHEESVSPEYKKGFNYGYMIAEHIPDLAQQLSKATTETDRFKGLKHGIEQYTLEQSKDRMPDWLKKNRLDNPDREKGIEDIDRE